MPTKIYAARLKDRIDLEQSSSGGVFTAISDLFLDAGNAVLCSLYDYETKRTVFSMIMDKKVRDQARGSKYMQSYPQNSMSEAESWLKNHPEKKLLFVGTGCQADGFRRFSEIKGIRGRVIIVDIICHGAPSPLVWRDYAGSIETDSSISYITFKDKRDGWLKPRSIAVINGKEVSIQSYRNLFSRRVIIRPSCFECPFCRIDRESDITIGDFWHIEDKIPDFYDEMGNSVVLVHTDNGAEIFEQIKDSIEWVESSREDCWQQNLERPTSKPHDRDMFWKDYRKHGIEYVMKLYGEKTMAAKARHKIKIITSQILRGGYCQAIVSCYVDFSERRAA